MERWLLQTPKLLVALVLGGGLAALLLIFEPPPTVCSTQMDVFKESQKGFLYERGTRKAPLPPEFEVEFQRCADVGGMGGCLALFEGLRQMVHEVQPLRAECQAELVSSGAVKSALERAYTLMAHLAWGGAAPQRVEDRTGWFEKGDLHLFCQLDRYLRLARGDQGMAALQREVMSSLPGADKVSSDEVWAKTLLSLNCSVF